VLSSVALLKDLRAAYPAAPLYLSCSTLAGRAIAEEKVAGLVDGVFYAPLDYVWCIRQVLRRIRPALVVIMETEIWPNLYREAKLAGAALVVVNGRISDRAYPRYLRWKWFFCAALAQPDLILVQSEEDARRYRAVGAPDDRVELGGNLKYDFNPGTGEIPAAIREFLQAASPSAVVVAASTMPPRDAADVDEDDIVLRAFGELAERHPRLLMILVPRRPDRFDVVARKLEAAGVPFVRRSALPAAGVPPLPAVLLLDSMGELGRLFALADLVFMGGTFPRRGGHNILEPAFFGKPVVAGPHMENFAAIADEFTRAGALVRVERAEQLGGVLSRLLDDAEERGRVGLLGRELAAAKRGVTGRVTQRLVQHYLRAVPLLRRSSVFAPLALLWRMGARRKRERAIAVRRRLDRPVISVGGITMGGAGKTPFVDWLTMLLRSRRLQPAILTRGYRRRSSEEYVVLAAGTPAPFEVTGDEPQIYLRRGAAHLGVGADRYTCGRKLLEALDADVFVLDDGFQHWRLARDFDVVLIDAWDPFGGGEVFPRGRLREELDALGRANAFVITRVEPGVRTDAIEHELRRWNARAPVFRSRVTPRGWLEVGTGAEVDALPGGAVSAFCGLANPRPFWRSLESLGLDVRFRWAFGDHHSYRVNELRRFGHKARHAGAGAVVITEKDIPNLPPNALQILAPLPVFALRIGVEIDDQERFLELVSAFSGQPTAPR
jgi:3-deoxy-D-manno-octulosonic-acid transferase